LKARGVSFKNEIEDHGYGFVTHFTMPGGVEVQLYEPKYVKKRARSETGSKSGDRARLRSGTRKPKISSK